MIEVTGRAEEQSLPTRADAEIHWVHRGEWAAGTSSTLPTRSARWSCRPAGATHGAGAEPVDDGRASASPRHVRLRQPTCASCVLASRSLKSDVVPAGICDDEDRGRPADGEGRRRGRSDRAVLMTIFAVFVVVIGVGMMVSLNSLDPEHERKHLDPILISARRVRRSSRFTRPRTISDRVSDR